jgi:hypothetical protein
MRGEGIVKSSVNSRCASYGESHCTALLASSGCTSFVVRHLNILNSESVCACRSPKLCTALNSITCQISSERSSGSVVTVPYCSSSQHRILIFVAVIKCLRRSFDSSTCSVTPNDVFSPCRIKACSKSTIAHRPPARKSATISASLAPD